MLDVHPPHHSAESWRDFFIHIATIVVGLLIAIGLEQSVEWLHNRHVLHHTEASLRTETRDNQERLARDEQLLDAQEDRIEHNLQLLAAAQQHQPVTEEFSLPWSWDGPHDNAWQTARANNAIALMPYEVSEAWDTIYGQQAIVDAQTTAYIRDIYRVEGPLSRGRTLKDLHPEELTAMATDAHQLLADLRLLRDLCHSLDNVYRNNADVVQ